MWDPDLYKKALDFAAKAHGTQQVPGSGFPYVVHLTKVAMEVMRACSEERLDGTLAVTCAILHDCMEDAGVTQAQVEQTFGPQVAAGVSALTKNESLAKPDAMRDSLARIKRQPPQIAMVKLADRITNLEPPPPKWTVEKRTAYLEEAKTILATLSGTSPWLERRLASKIADYYSYCRP
jgi:(p)ppGpp synthase/HD superfamily hydrolase